MFTLLYFSMVVFPFRNKQRMHFALRSLLQEAQNNLKIFKVRDNENNRGFFVPHPACPITYVLLLLCSDR